MDVLSIEQMLACEEEAFKSGISASALMEAAGEAMAHRITALYPHARIFVVLAGKGNNGGDGLVVARHLAEAGRLVRIVLAAPEDQFSDLPRRQLDRLRDCYPQPEIATWHDEPAFPGGDGVVIDALLGLQASGSLRGALADIVAKLNTARATRFFRTVSLDFPSGLAAYEKSDAPQNRDAVVVADLTIAVGFAKEPLVREALSAWVGRLEVVPWTRARFTSAPRQILLAQELTGLLPRRSALSYKGDFGRLTIVAGSPGFTGAPVLCAQAAQAAGAGLLSIVTRTEVLQIVAATSPPEAMVLGWGEPGSDVLTKASAIVIGPGLGTNERCATMLRRVLAVGCPVLIDADGLTILSRHIDYLHKAQGPVVLTPHPGEMARLIGHKFGPDEREEIVFEFTQEHNATLVLKGTRTLVAARGQALHINTTGNPGLSTGGSGDTLSGIIGALLAQGIVPLDAARFGVWVHGHAADLVLAERGCEEGLTPTMVSAHLGAAITSLRAQSAPPPGLLEQASNWKAWPEPY